ncbi:MAG: hypothetical protein IKW44_04350, partial [Bacteroidaceae bacterium]|nr:hypothetical protein [Bacteroidaceae bacterium]
MSKVVRDARLASCHICGSDDVELLCDYSNAEQRNLYHIYCSNCGWGFVPQSTWSVKEIVEKWNQLYQMDDVKKMQNEIYQLFGILADDAKNASATNSAVKSKFAALEATMQNDTVHPSEGLLAKGLGCESESALGAKENSLHNVIHNTPQKFLDHPEWFEKPQSPSVRTLNLSKETISRLAHANICTLNDLKSVSRDEFLSILGSNIEGYMELLDECNKRGISLHNSNYSSFAYGHATKRQEKKTMEKWIHVYDEKSGTHHYDCPVCDDGYATKHDGPPSAFCQTCGTQLAELSEEAKQA